MIIYNDDMDMIIEILKTLISTIVSIFVEFLKLILTIFGVKDTMENIMLAGFLGVPLAVAGVVGTIIGIVAFFVKHAKQR